jgi:hypothetical protein
MFRFCSFFKETIAVFRVNRSIGLAEQSALLVEPARVHGIGSAADESDSTLLERKESELRGNITRFRAGDRLSRSDAHLR